METIGGPGDALPRPGRDTRRLRLAILIGVAALLAIVAAFYWHAAANTNHEALSSAPRPVTVVRAEAGTFRASREYVGTLEPWNAARVGPQYVAAYVGTVLVRPGAVVKRGEVLATLDCRNASAASKEIAARATALEQMQVASEHEAARVKELERGGFESANLAEKLAAHSSSEKAEIESLRASLVTRTLEVDDCILRAPFSGDVGDRLVDPGAFVRPGNPVVIVVDRATVRVVGDAPESDYAVVAPETPVAIEVVATGARLVGRVSRRTPAADQATRTIHFEIDLPNADRVLPVGTTARIAIDFGDPKAAVVVPLGAAAVRGEKATLFVAEGGLAKRKSGSVLGERDGRLYLAPSPQLAAGAQVVIEGRGLLEEGDRVTLKEASE